MDFDHLLDQAIEMLQRRGRLTYRTLKRQFELDNETLEDLTFELIEGQRLARDENGTVLIWAGEADGTPEVASPSEQETPSPVIESDTSTPIEPSLIETRHLSTETYTPEAERRQLTVMFIDLVDSTALAFQLDPEDYREVVRAYQATCTEVIHRYDGHIAQLLGDGLLVYFGYPQAHEDDAHRAVRTGLGIRAAMGDLNTHLQQAKGIQLALRIGVHTGLVVVGHMGSTGSQQQLALGETPNVAARIQGLAAPNTLVISAATHGLIQGYFACESLGEQTLRGVTDPVTLYRVLSESGATSRLDVAQPRGLTPLVGREAEVTLLLERWGQAKAGQGHVILLSGDAGIGKSRLVQTLKDHVANEPHVRWECRSSSYFENTALFPMTELFQRLLQFHAEGTPDEKLRKLEQMLRQYRLPLEETVPLLAPLLALPLPEQHYPPLNLSPQRQRQKTLESLVAILLELAERQPVLFVLEDLHWSDPSTLELLNLMIEQTPTASLLTVLTCRPTFHPSWTHKSFLTEMSITRLAQPQVERMVERVAGGKTLPPEVLQQIIAKTDGVPLFVEELTKAILESGYLKEADGHYELTGSFSTFAIPATLQDSLMARLDRLVTAKSVAQIGATIGRQFAYDLLSMVSQLDEVTLQRELGRLVEAELLYQRGLPPQSTYMFKHALIQDIAYQSLLKSTRQHYHQRIAQTLAAQFPETVTIQPELLAHHYTEAGLHEQAVGYWQQAGEKAIARSAYVEATEHLTKGGDLLRGLPETQERAQHELHLLMLLGPVWMATKGYGSSEVIHAYDRAQELCQHLGNTPQTLSVFLELSRLDFVQAKHRTALELGTQCLRMAQRQHEPTFLLEAYVRVGASLSVLGQLSAAHAHLEEARAMYHVQPRRSSRATQDSGVACLSFLAWTFVPLGYQDHALTCIHQALAIAQDLSHPFSRAFATNHAAIIHQLRREPQAAQVQAEASLQITQAQGFPLLSGFNLVLRGWALAMQGEAEEGVAQISQGLETYRPTGHKVFYPWSLARLAEAYGQHGQPEEALTLLAEALTVVDTTEERMWEAELYRLKGALILVQSPDHHTEAEICFQHAITIAQSQSAKSWELRATTSLARLWQRQGKRAAAYELLAPIYGWFTQGFDTVDLKDAKALLDELAR